MAVRRLTNTRKSINSTRKNTIVKTKEPKNNKSCKPNITSTRLGYTYKRQTKKICTKDGIE